MLRHSVWAGLAILIWLSGVALGQCLRVVPGPGNQVAGPRSGTCSLQWDLDGDGPLAAGLVVGGVFEGAGEAGARNIAYWDGSRWMEIGEGFNDQVNALAVYNGELIAAGRFTASGPVQCAHIARWDVAQAAWLPLGSGISGEVLAMAWHANRLYVGGTFATAGGLTVNNIAAWNGVWTGVGGGVLGDHGGFSTPVYAMASYQNELYVGGWFEYGGGTYSPNFIKWTGTGWAALGADQPVMSMATWSSSTTLASRLYCGGPFSNIAGNAISSLAIYSNQGVWSGTAGYPTPNGALALRANRVGQNGVELYAYCNGAAGLYRYSSTGAWSGIGTYQSAMSIEIMQGQVVAVGAGVHRWDGSAYWRPLGLGVDGGIRDVASLNGELYFGGLFTIADQQVVNRIARFDGTTFHAVGGGFNGDVLTLAVYQGELIAGGFFTTADGRTAMGTARWDGFSWTSMPGGAQYVYALLVHNNELYEAGAGGVFRWSGATWLRVGSSFTSSSTTVAAWNGHLYTNNQGGTYRLENNMWVIVSDMYHQTLAPAGARLLGTVPGQNTYQVRAFDGSVWETLVPLSSGLSGGVWSTDAGTFADLGGRLHRWTSPNSWELVTNTHGGISSLREIGDELIAVGGFDAADGHAAGNWVRLGRCCGTPDFDCNGDIGTDADIEAFFACLSGACPAAPCTNSADFNHDGDIGTDGDIEAFFRVLAGGSC